MSRAEKVQEIYATKDELSIEDGNPKRKSILIRMGDEV